MAWFTHSSRFALLAVALVLSSSFPVSAQVTPLRISTSPSLANELENAFRPPKRGAPDNRQGGATRGPCFVDQRQDLTALVPGPEAKTATEYPIVSWYMPEMTSNEDDAPAPAIIFRLKDASHSEEGKEVYTATYPLNKSGTGIAGTPGIMTLPIAHPYALEVGKKYYWELRVTCDIDSPDRSGDQYDKGEITRVALNDSTFTQRLQQATPEERVVLYAQNQLWYEMLSDLVNLRRDRPTDRNLAEAWNTLMNMVELKLSAKEPLFQDARNTSNY
ncbi:MAG: DUF928 domain-containing protein [Cyanobacteriota bacterium]